MGLCDILRFSFYRQREIDPLPRMLYLDHAIICYISVDENAKTNQRQEAKDGP